MLPTSSEMVCRKKFNENLENPIGEQRDTQWLETIRTNFVTFAAKLVKRIIIKIIENCVRIIKKGVGVLVENERRRFFC